MTASEGWMDLPTPAIPLFCIISCLLFVVGLLFPWASSLSTRALFRSVPWVKTAGPRRSVGTTCLYRGAVLEQAAVLILFSLFSHFCSLNSHYGASLRGDSFWLQRTCSDALPSGVSSLPRLCPTAKCANTVSVWLHPLIRGLWGRIYRVAMPPQVSPVWNKPFMVKSGAWRELLFGGVVLKPGANTTHCSRTEICPKPFSLSSLYEVS